MLPLVELAALGRGSSLLAPLRRHGFVYVRGAVGDGVSLARRIFAAPGAAKGFRGHVTTPANPRGLYAYKGTPQGSADAIIAYQYGAARTRQLREAYYAPDEVPDSAVHDNVPLDDAVLMADIQALYDELCTVSQALFDALAVDDVRLRSLRGCTLDPTLEFKCYRGGPGNH
jgi:hypothetical protein